MNSVQKQLECCWTILNSTNQKPLFLQCNDRLYFARNGLLIPVGTHDYITAKPRRILEYQAEHARNAGKPEFDPLLVAQKLGVRVVAPDLGNEPVVANSMLRT